MREYEAMFIMKPDSNEEEFNKATSDLKETIKKEKGEIVSADKWSEKKQLSYELRVPATGGHAKYREGIYYLVVFKFEPKALDKLNQAFKLDEDVLRVLITVKG